jgi:hypothetical protein
VSRGCKWLRENVRYVFFRCNIGKSNRPSFFFVMTVMIFDVDMLRFRFDDSNFDQFQRSLIIAFNWSNLVSEELSSNLLISE